MLVVYIIFKNKKPEGKSSKSKLVLTKKAKPKNKNKLDFKLQNVYLAVNNESFCTDIIGGSTIDKRWRLVVDHQRTT